MFGFGKSKKQRADDSQELENHSETPLRSSDDISEPGSTEDGGNQPFHSGDVSGPYDGDTVDIHEFDFSDFSENILNLGSLRIALPQRSQVRVEMGDNSPKMLHIDTEYGSITPIAFAAAKSSGLWDKALVELADDLRKQGLTVTSEHGPWGEELVGYGNGGTIRVIGVDGPRWMVRFTAMSPDKVADRLAELTREMMAHTFVYRGTDAILAGSAIPVLLPKEIMDQLMAAVQQGAGHPGAQK